jgi:hypothetical protein
LTGAIRGGRPWPVEPRNAVEYEPPAERWQAPYRCERGHDFAVTFAAGAIPPGTWRHRCGAAAAYAGNGPTGTGPRPPKRPARVEDDPEHHLGMVLARRTRADLETLLAASLAAVRGASPSVNEQCPLTRQLAM